MKKVIKEFYRGLVHIAFPNVCVCCGEEFTGYQHQVCTFCLEDRFDDANRDNIYNTSDTLLPEGVLVQFALWNFYKGGDLQHLIHQFKYERLVTVGVDLGIKLGEHIQNLPSLSEKIKEDAIILPVPLHHKRYRSRGFNQSREIARGFQQVWSHLKICDKESLIRTKRTRTQTGFSLQRRTDNVRGAFHIKNRSAFAGKMIIIIDDVFTTGATTYELAQTLLDAGSGYIIIFTLAQA